MILPNKQENSITRIVATLLHLLFFSLTAMGNESDNITFSHLTINEGLSHSTVYSILQDKNGFIWIGTQDGLNKYDGYEFEIFRSQKGDSTALKDDHINSMLEDHQGNLWIGTANGLHRFNPATQTFTFFHHVEGEVTSSNNVTSLLEDKKGNIWVGTYNGISQLDQENKTFHHFPLPAKIQTVGRKKTETLFLTKEGEIWIGTRQGLFIFNPDSHTYQALPEAWVGSPVVTNAHIRTIVEANEQYWIGTENHGLFLWDNSSRKARHFSTEDGLPSMMIRDILLFSKDEIWIGTREGLSIYHKEKDEFTNHVYSKYKPNSLSHNSVRSIYKDNDGNVWVGTFSGGVNVYFPRSNYFKTYQEQMSESSGLSHPVVSSLVQDNAGNLWVGTEGGGLNFISQNKSSYAYFQHDSKENSLISDNVKSLSMDAKGNLWVGTYDGLSYFDAKKKVFHNYHSTTHPLAHNQIYSLLADEGGVWIGTNGGGVNYLTNSGEFRHFEHDSTDTHSLLSNHVTTFALDHENNVWIGTTAGLNYFDKEKQQMLRAIPNEGTQSPRIRSNILSLFYDSHHRLWIGTQGEGLRVYNTNHHSLYSFHKNDGLANDNIQAILQDNAGNIWVSTDTGLSKLTFFLENTDSLRLIEISNYNMDDGLQSNQFLREAAVRGKGGELFFGGINGFNAFYPHKILKNLHKPPVVLTDFLIKNESVPINEEESPLHFHINETKKITLPYDKAFFTIRFAALNFISSAKNQYAYRLEGLRQNDQWNYVGTQQSATFTNLDAGYYTFTVKASNNDGVWNEEGATLEIEVLPPFWKTWWAYFLYALVISGLLYIFYYFSQKTARLQHDLKLENITHEKELELQQSKLRFFTNISHEIKTPLTLIMAPLDNLIVQNAGENKVLNQLMLMKRNGDHLLKLIGQLLDFRRFDAQNIKIEAAEGNLVRFVREIYISFKGYARHQNKDFQFHAEHEDIKAWFDRDKLEKIMYNLLSNAFKFTPESGSITLSISQEKGGIVLQGGNKADAVVIRVADTGVGISKEDQEKIFDRFHTCSTTNQPNQSSGIGLAFTKELVALHKGSISVTSQLQEENHAGSTCFTVRLPLGHRHLDSHEMMSDFQDSENINGYLPDLSTLLETQLSEKKSVISKAFQKEKPIMLIVEDNQDVRNLIIDYFASDFEIYEGCNGQEGKNLAMELLPDIIISDVMMPLIDGIELCAFLKADVHTSHIPIILLTARTPLIFKIEGFETGADDYITKPFNLQVLEVRVWNLLESRKKLRDRYQREVTLQPQNIALNSPDEKLLEKVMQYIEANLSEPSLNVEELGREVGMSRVHLYRKIKALTNETVVEFIRNVRLQRAAQLLTQNKLNVFEIAYMVGFQDIDYFRKCFKKRYHQTPSTYALENKELSDESVK